MIQNELLPGCAVIVRYPNDTEEVTYNPDLHFNGILFPIPLTTESVAKVEGFVPMYGGFIYARDEPIYGRMTFFVKEGKVTFYQRNYSERNVPNHITSIHQLQILIYSLTGTMPKYDIG